MRRPIIGVLAALALVALDAAAQNYPTKPIRFVVPFAEVDAPGLVSRRPVRGKDAHAPGFYAAAMEYLVSTKTSAGKKPAAKLSVA